MWNLDPKLYVEPLLMRNLYVKLLSGTFMTNLFAKRLCGTFLWKLGTCICATWELVRAEPLCGTLGNLTLYVEPELLRVEHLCGTLGSLNFWECNLYSPQTRASSEVPGLPRWYTGWTTRSQRGMIPQPKQTGRKDLLTQRISRIGDEETPQTTGIMKDAPKFAGEEAEGIPTKISQKHLDEVQNLLHANSCKAWRDPRRQDEEHGSTMRHHQGAAKAGIHRREPS